LIEGQIEDTARARGISKEALASDAAAAITGCALSIDGGWVAQ